MKRFLCILLGLAGLAQASDWTHGKYGRAFMDQGVNARYLGMGGAAVAIVDDITAVYWNPAGLGLLDGYSLHAMHDERFAGAVNWDYLGGGMALKNGMNLGFGFFRLGVDQIPLTRLRDPSRGLGEVYIDDDGRQVVNDPYAYDWVDDQEMAFVLSVAKRRTTRFGYGLSMRVIRKLMDPYSAWGLGFDLGFQWTPRPNLYVGGVLTDATSTVLAWEGGNTEVIRPRLMVGAAYGLEWRHFSLLPALDIKAGVDHLGDAAQFHAGSLDLELAAGLEVTVVRRAAIRLGVDAGYLTAGAGVRLGRLRVDYGFASHADLGDSHRVSVGLNQFAGKIWPN